MPNSFTGGCLCGAVRYECSAEPLMLFKCHCRDCQRLSGGAYMPVVYISLSAFKLTQGSLQYHHTQSARGGQHKRGFCAACGSRITGGESDRGIGVTASSLDDPSWFRPTMHIWTADVQPWDLLEADIPKFEQSLTG